MNAILTNVTSLKQFLKLPEIKPALEYIDGRIIQKMSPLLPHSVIQLQLAQSWNAFALTRQLGQAFVELRVVFGGMTQVPDVCFYSAGRVPKYPRRSKPRPVPFAPDLVAEILSPGQTVGELRHKIRLALRDGSQLGWLIRPRHEEVHVLRPGEKSQILKLGEVLNGETVLPGYSLALDEMFGWFD